MVKSKAFYDMIVNRLPMLCLYCKHCYHLVNFSQVGWCIFNSHFQHQCRNFVKYARSWKL